MMARKEGEQKHRVEDRTNHFRNLSVLEQRNQTETERRARFKSHYLSQNLDMLGQMTMRQQMRDSELAKIKEIEAKERQRIEQIHQKALEKEAEEKMIKKLKLIQMTEQDRKLKEEQKLAMQG